MPAFRTMLFLLLLAATDVAVAQVQTTTTSSGYMENFEYVYDGRRNDAYQTNIVGLIDGQQVAFDLTFFRAIDDADVRNAMRGFLATRGVAAGGAPGVLTWSGAETLEIYEEFLDSFTDVSTTVVTQTSTTVQVTSGDAPGNIAIVGERGTCYSTGTSGETNFGDLLGRFAECDGYEEFEVVAGTVNTNTHTTTVNTTIETSFTNEDYLTYGFYRYTGTITLIGHVHTAVQDGGFDLGSGFATRLLAEVAPGVAAFADDARVRVWIGGHGGERDRGGDGGIAGHERRWSGSSAGIVFAPRPDLLLGLAGDRSRADIDADGAPEWADIALTQVGVHGRWQPGRWYVGGLLARGRGDVDAVHGNAALGGVAAANYDLRVDQAALELGFVHRAGGFQVAPHAGIGRQRVRSDAFAETGGIALVADAHERGRTRGWLGLDAGHEWKYASGYFRIGARLNVADTLSGDPARLPVALASAPDDPLWIAGLADDGNVTSLALDAVVGIGRHAALFVAIEGDDAGSGERWNAGLRVDW